MQVKSADPVLLKRMVLLGNAAPTQLHTLTLHNKYIAPFHVDSASIASFARFDRRHGASGLHCEL